MKIRSDELAPKFIGKNITFIDGGEIVTGELRQFDAAGDGGEQITVYVIVDPTAHQDQMGEFFLTPAQEIEIA